MVAFVALNVLKLSIWFNIFFCILTFDMIYCSRFCQGLKKSIIMFFKIVNQLSINLDIIEN